MTKLICSDIILTLDVSSGLSQYLQEKKYSKICVLVDENTEKFCYPLVQEALLNARVIKIESGEEHKNLSTCAQIWNQLTDLQLDRKALLINLGGGVIGDMGGFCAATYKRGIDFIQIPTTLLSQVDASVGGKLGIDFHGFKNHIGVFQNPVAVFIDTNFLKTLAKEELRSGYAEIIKHCLIADKLKWDEISAKPLNEQDWSDLTAHSVEIKSKVADKDPLEKGLRKILNFGHTIGHALETYFLNEGRKILHGEAIAVGMITETYLSHRREFILQEELDHIREYILSVYGKVAISEADIEKMLPLALQDKKNESNLIQCSLLERVGEANFNNPISFEEIREAINYYNS